MCNDKKDEHYGYCWCCLLNDDSTALHPYRKELALGTKVNRAESRGCLYPDMVFPLAWVVVGDAQMRRSLAAHMRDSRIETVEGFQEWMMERVDGDKKWRNFATHLIVWFYNSYKPQEADSI